MYWKKVEWGTHLPLEELAYNNSFQVTLKMAPNEVLYKRKCKTLLYWNNFKEWKILGLGYFQEAREHVVLPFLEKLFTYIFVEFFFFFLRSFHERALFSLWFFEISLLTLQVHHLFQFSSFYYVLVGDKWSNEFINIKFHKVFLSSLHCIHC